jgi:hypothetical protein
MTTPTTSARSSATVLGLLAATLVAAGLFLSSCPIPRALTDGAVPPPLSAGPGPGRSFSGKAPFVEFPTVLPGSRAGAGVFLDVEGDGHLDIILTGNDDVSTLGGLYRNIGGRYIATSSPLPKLRSQHALACADYDADGDVDVAVAGSFDVGGVQSTAKIFRNDGGTLVDIHAPLEGMSGGPVLWIDDDGDGDLDLLVGGSPDQGVTLTTRIYRNDHGSFLPSEIQLPNLWASSAACGDLDGDGDVDLFLMGYNGSIPASGIYWNTGGSFTDAKLPFTGALNGDAAVIDYDADGDLDIAYNGTTPYGPTTKLYRNDGHGVFTEVFQAWDRLEVSAMAWADIDRDGDLDMAESGIANAPNGDLATVIYRNDRGVFVDVGADLMGVWCGSLAWGDVDNDSWPDLLVTGGTVLGLLNNGTWPGPYGPVTLIYRNTGRWSASAYPSKQAR